MQAKTIHFSPAQVVRGVLSSTVVDNKQHPLSCFVGMQAQFGAEVFDLFFSFDFAKMALTLEAESETEKKKLFQKYLSSANKQSYFAERLEIERKFVALQEAAIAAAWRDGYKAVEYKA